MTKFTYPQLDTKYRYRTHNIFKNIIYQKLPIHSHILDVGCASGNIAKLTKPDYKVSGIENSHQYFKKAKSICDKFYQINLNNLQELKKIAPKQYDLIVLGDVLEHLNNPSQTLKYLLPKLKTRGYLIISLPNIAQLPFRISHLFGKFDYSTSGGVMDNTHLHFYTLKTATALIKEHKNINIIKIYPAGTIYSFFPFLPTLIAPQFVFLCQKN